LFKGDEQEYEMKHYNREAAWRKMFDEADFNEVKIETSNSQISRIFSFNGNESENEGPMNREELIEKVLKYELLNNAAKVKELGGFRIMIKTRKIED
jgi:hypothetical protein